MQKEAVLKSARTSNQKSLNFQHFNNALLLKHGTGQDFLDPIRPVNFKIYASRPPCRPIFDRPGRLVFVHCSMHLMKIFQKGSHGRGVKICDFGRVSLKKMQKKFLRFLQK